MSERFYVTEIEGYGFSPGSKTATSLSIIDSLDCCREVRRYYADQVSGYPRLAERRILARDEAARLNALCA